ncbi:HAD-superfamily class IIA hydrolase, TIGR01459 [Saccharicrinis carchari]|uniref:HAD-superfamily class IIA hydrolase, TIGR01459 n=1 Tax=Saccharicrinis carchari TaxID=1168039 RepID=A0A521DMP6_SACCC|nr:HAD-IIA family hydrolase [Saccharicrinis carchari]SMO72872.1 HAD-superfamily class IIA hydrolase, TIGR01459 [Saccharicrinis carchari]
MHIVKFSELTDQYKVIFFDAYGVLINHAGMMDGVKEMFDDLKHKGIYFYIITNDASSSPELLAKYYNDRGIEQVKPENMVSSAMMSMRFLKENVPPGASVAYLGRPTSEYYIRKADLVPIRIETVKPTNYPQLGAIVLFDDAGYDFQPAVNKTLNVIRGTDVPVIVANPDLIYPVNEYESALAVGSVGNMLEKVANRSFFRFGKPDVSVFELAFELVNKKRTISKREVLMVGDTLDTDIAGGNNFGIDTALVLSGSTLKNQAVKMMDNKQIKPTYICNSIMD